MQGLHGLLNRGVRVEAMALKHIDIIELQPLQARFDTVKDMFSAQSTPVHQPMCLRIISNRIVVPLWQAREVYFCKDHKSFTRSSNLFYGFAEDAFRLAIRIGIGRVESLGVISSRYAKI